jgi:hypothetical protein
VASHAHGQVEVVCAIGKGATLVGVEVEAQTEARSSRFSPMAVTQCGLAHHNDASSSSRMIGVTGQTRVQALVE